MARQLIILMSLCLVLFGATLPTLAANETPNESTDHTAQAEHILDTCVLNFVGHFSQDDLQTMYELLQTGKKATDIRPEGNEEAVIFTSLSTKTDREKITRFLLTIIERTSQPTRVSFSREINKVVNRRAGKKEIPQSYKNIWADVVVSDKFCAVVGQGSTYSTKK